MTWIGWIIFGLIAGAIAKAIHPGKDPGGWLVTILIGIVGSVIGGFIAGIIGITKSDSFWSFGNWIISIAAAILLLFLYRKFQGSKV
jgi:uncharacterized membrane protein YeaQ/YmgE (transglycosylase-associated protein family)